MLCLTGRCVRPSLLSIDIVECVVACGDVAGAAGCRYQNYCDHMCCIFVFCRMPRPLCIRSLLLSVSVWCSFAFVGVVAPRAGGNKNDGLTSGLKGAKAWQAWMDNGYKDFCEAQDAGKPKERKQSFNDRLGAIQELPGAGSMAAGHFWPKELCEREWGCPVHKDQLTEDSNLVKDVPWRVAPCGRAANRHQSRHGPRHAVHISHEQI